MKTHYLLRTNLLICCIIMVGFSITSVVSYKSNIAVFEKEAEHVSTLATNSIYAQIDAIFSKPITISLTMANDHLLKTFLMGEGKVGDHSAYTLQMQQYLDAYRAKYGYDSLFLVSAATNNYYHFRGLNRTLEPDNPENAWYYSFINSDEEFAINVDNDEATDNSITVFINCKIKDAKGAVMGVVGVGFRIQSLQKTLQLYNDQFNVQAFLINSAGAVEISPEISGEDPASTFGTPMFATYKGRILANKQDMQHFWYANESQSGYIISRYIENLRWYLVVCNTTSLSKKSFKMQLLYGVTTVIVVILLVLGTITYVIRQYNARIIQLTIVQEFEHQSLVRQSTEELYDSIYEFDISRDCAGSPSAHPFFARVGIPPTGSFDAALHATAQQHIQEVFRQGYLDTFQRDSVIRMYEKGLRDRSYEFMATNDGGKNFRWVRVNAQIFFWNSDNSLRMIMYSKDIHAEKTRELLLLDASQRDALTGLYNKIATETYIGQVLQAGSSSSAQHAFLMFDIDSFKHINDTGGHALGDVVIAEFAHELTTHFRRNDVVGRIGGDEFSVLVKNYGQLTTLCTKLETFRTRCATKVWAETPGLKVLTSIGVALSPQHGTSYAELYEKSDQALYYSKSHGKNRFTIFGQDMPAHDPDVQPST